MKRVLIQGAIESEVSYYLEQSCFRDVVAVERNGFLFYEAQTDGLEVIVQLTKMGMVHAAMATMTAIYEFRPDIIVNQGTAGAQVEALSSGDMVIGQRAVNVHSIEMPKRGYGEGIAPVDWRGMATEYLEADKGLVHLFAEGIGEHTRTGTVIAGTLGSGDLFSKEKDRIMWLHETFGNVSEDMESFAVYAACRECQIPCVSIRVISNNELLDEDYDKDTAIELQRVIWETLMSAAGSEW